MSKKTEFKHELTLKIVTIDEFLAAVPMQYAKEFAVAFNQKQKTLTSDADGSTSEYVRKMAYLKTSFSKKAGKTLARQLVKYELKKPVTSHEAIEEMAVESMMNFGQPKMAVIVENFLCVLNPDDFRIYFRYDVFGHLYGTIACWNKPGNLKVDATTGKVIFIPPNFSEQQAKDMEATIAKAKELLK